ncbi:GAF domain-containing protein, partial [Baaleninema sp.]|uniref:GAF domain-containing protein n=1 Tax=Baaleninema sp. TaxID=3101197 RepID=UPI003CFF42B7
MSERDLTLRPAEYNALTRELETLRERVSQLERQLERQLDSQSAIAPQQVAQQQALLAVVTKIRESLDLEIIFKSTATEVRQLLNADRVGMYRFDPGTGYQWGEFVSEDVVSPYPSTLSARIRDRCFGKYIEGYRQGRIWACQDIHAFGLSSCHLEILDRFAVRANLVVPLLEGDRLWGLLCIHQCSSPRHWTENEIEFVTQIALHLGVALQQAEFVVQLQEQSESLSQAVADAVEREKAVAAIIDKIRRSLELNTIFNTTTEEVRHLLKADRVTIYRFNPDWSGEFLVESIEAGWTSLIERQRSHPQLCRNISECSIKALSKPFGQDTYLQETEGGDFTRGEVFRLCEDIYQAGFSDCYIEALEGYEARAYAIIAIYKGEKLWGLLAAFQNGRSRQWQEEEVNFLVQIGAQLGVAIQQAELLARTQKDKAQLQNALTTELRRRADELAEEANRERALAQIVDKIRRTLDLDTIFRTATTEVRQLLDADRVAVFRFHPNSRWQEGTFVSEAVLPEYRSALNSSVSDRCFGEDYAIGYQQGEIFAVADIRQGKLSNCHLGILEQFQIRANLVVPLIESDRLWGLLCVHQCSSPRQWQGREIEFARKIAVQLGVALQQSQLLAQAQNRSRELQKALAQVQAQKEQQAQAAQQERALARTIERIRQTLDIETIFGATTQDVREILQCDRMVVYRFLPDWSGEFVFESVDSQWIALARPDFKTVWEDSYLQETQGGRYRNRETLAVDDIETANHTDCYLDVLRQFQVKLSVAWNPRRFSAGRK